MAPVDVEIFALADLTVEPKSMLGLFAADAVLMGYRRFIPVLSMKLYRNVFGPRS